MHAVCYVSATALGDGKHWVVGESRRQVEGKFEQGQGQCFADTMHCEGAVDFGHAPVMGQPFGGSPRNLH